MLKRLVHCLNENLEELQSKQQHKATLVFFVAHLTVSPQMNGEHKYFIIGIVIPKVPNKLIYAVSPLHLQMSEMLFEIKKWIFKPKGLNKEIKARIQSKGAKVLGLQRTEKDMEKK